MSCTERGCPYPTGEGEELCRHHREFFAYEVSLEDRGIDLQVDSLTGDTPDGLRIIGVKSRENMTRQDRIDRIYGKLLGSAAIVGRIVDHLEQAPKSQKSDWLNNHFAAQELFDLARYGGKPVCHICGCKDIKQSPRDYLMLRFCKLCWTQFSVLNSTVFSNGKLVMLNRWVRGIEVLRSGHQKGVIEQAAGAMECTYKTASRINNVLHVCGLVTHKHIGFAGLSNNRTIPELKARLGLTQ